MNPLGKVGSIGQTLVEILETRLELFGVEWRHEKARLAALIGCVTLASASFVLMGVAFVVGLALMVPVPYRPYVMLGVCFVTLLLLCFCIFMVFYLVGHKRNPFSATCTELKRDVECLASILKEKK